MHFENLWELCEDFHKNTIKENSISSVMDQLTLKISVYKMLVNQNDYLSDELIKAKSTLLGEILFTITLLSLRDNINVFDALNNALKERK